MMHKMGKRNGKYVPNLFSVIVNRNLHRHGFTLDEINPLRTFGLFEYANKVKIRFIRIFGNPDLPEH